MPSTYSKKRKKKSLITNETCENETHTDSVKSPGGPLKRTGNRVVVWDEALGKSLHSLPLSQLPTKRTVLRRYRHMRIENPVMATYDLAKRLSYEIVHIWNCARIPTAKLDKCAGRVIETIDHLMIL